MEDNEQDIKLLVEKYEQARVLGKAMYFDADEFALLAEYYNSEGDSDEAELLIEEGLRMHPGSMELMLMKVKVFVYDEMYEEALEYMKWVMDDGDVDFLLLKIESLLYLGRDDEANELIDKTLSRDLSAEDYYYFITEVGYLLNDVDQFNRGIHLLEESMKINRSNSDAIVDLAYAYEMKGDYEKAIDYNNQLLDIDPYSFDGWVNIGKLFSMNKQYDKAVDAFDFALTINEDNVNVLKMKALSLFMNDNVDKSIALFEECLQRYPYDETVYDSLFESYASMEWYDELVHLIDRKETLFGSKGIVIKRALVCVYTGDYEKANELFNQVPEEERETLDYFMLEAELAFYQKDYPRAEGAYIKAALVSEGNEDVLDRLANVSVVQGKFEQAAKYLEELLELDPSYPTAKSRLAFVRFEIGSKEPFDEIMNQFSYQELRSLLELIMGNDSGEFSDYSREQILIRLNEARENRVLFKNIKY